jgi:putative FmdB family regulatory protein
MPMYEYACQSCQGTFTKLRRMDQNDQDISCPSCGTEEVKRKLSVFASFSKSSGGEVTATAGGGGGCCGGGGGCACSAN